MSHFKRRDAVVPRAFLLRAAVALFIFWALLLALVPRARADASLAGVHPVLAAKAREITRACNAHVISAVRRTRVAGTRRMSLHASGRAVDLRGPPRCIYAHLRGWRGGYSTDYRRVAHAHVSWGGSEHGKRFAHRHVGRVRAAHRPHHRGRLRLASRS